VIPFGRYAPSSTRDRAAAIVSGCTFAGAQTGAGNLVAAGVVGTKPADAGNIRHSGTWAGAGSRMPGAAGPVVACAASDGNSEGAPSCGFAGANGPAFGGTMRAERSTIVGSGCGSRGL
jgi:hypothetical protein